MFRFSHTAIVEGTDEKTGIKAIFTDKPVTTPLATNFNTKATPAGKGMRDMGLAQLDFCKAVVKDRAVSEQLNLGRAALVQRQRYEEHRRSAPAVEVAASLA